MKINILTLILLITSTFAFAQYDDPLYGNTKSESIDTIIDYTKIKFRLSKIYPRFFSIGKITGNPDINKKIKFDGYNKYFNNEVYKTIGLAIKKNIPPIDSPNFIDIDIKDFRFVRHQLFTDNYMVELSMDFFLRNNTVYKKVYSTSQALFLISKPKIERILAKLIKRTFQYFLEDQPSKNDIPYIDKKPKTIPSDTFEKGIYTSYDDIKNKKPSIELKGEISYIDTKGFQRYILKNQDFNSYGFNDDILGVSDGQNLYLNANRFYPNSYFIKLKKITSEIYYSYDGICDTKTRSASQAAIVGGLLGTLTMNGIGGTETMNQTGISVSRKCHLVIDIKTGSMIALTRKRLKSLLKGQDNELKRFKRIRALKDPKMMMSYIEMLIKKELIEPKF